MDALPSLPYLLLHVPAVALLIDAMLPGARHAIRHGRHLEYSALVLTTLHIIPLVYVVTKLPVLSIVSSGLAWFALLGWTIYARRGEMTPHSKPTRPE